jgi:hypothetical protein
MNYFFLFKVNIDLNYLELYLFMHFNGQSSNNDNSKYPNSFLQLYYYDFSIHVALSNIICNPTKNFL